jgi:hypothetical protein
LREDDCCLLLRLDSIFCTVFGLFIAFHGILGSPFYYRHNAEFFLD